MPSTQVAVRDFCCCHSAMADGVYAYSVILFRASGGWGFYRIMDVSVRCVERCV